MSMEISSFFINKEKKNLLITKGHILIKVSFFSFNKKKIANKRSNLRGDKPFLFEYLGLFLIH